VRWVDASEAAQGFAGGGGFFGAFERLPVFERELQGTDRAAGLALLGGDVSAHAGVVGDVTVDETEFAEQRRDTLASIEGISNSTSAASAAAEVRGELRSMRTSLERADGELRRQRARPRVVPHRFDPAVARVAAHCDSG
jgi:hypothetical protein